MLKPSIRNHIDIINSACEELWNLFKKWWEERNHLFPIVMKEFKSIIYRLFMFSPQKVWLHQMCIIFEKVSISQVKFCKSLYFCTKNSKAKKLRSWIFTKWIGLGDWSLPICTCHYLQLMYTCICNAA